MAMSDFVQIPPPPPRQKHPQYMVRLPLPTQYARGAVAGTSLVTPRPRGGEEAPPALLGYDSQPLTYKCAYPRKTLEPGKKNLLERSTNANKHRLRSGDIPHSPRNITNGPKSVVPYGMNQLAWLKRGNLSEQLPKLVQFRGRESVNKKDIAKSMRGDCPLSRGRLRL